MKRKVFVGLSGGVDSAVSAMILRDADFDVTGVFIKTWQPDYIECTSKEDRLDAMRVASELSIKFMTLDLENEYKKHVIDYMLKEYGEGNIPNPDIMCNKYIKFDAFYDFAKQNNAIIATGHYAKIEEGQLVVPKDKNKDQTYFLYQINKDILKDIIFPLANYTKDEVRSMAKEYNIWVNDKKDSQGICMLGGGIDLKKFLQIELKTNKGLVLDLDGKVIGDHDGAVLYAIGERHGFVINKNITNTSAYYVVSKDIYKNTISVDNLVKSKTDFKLINGFVIDNINLFINQEDINTEKYYNIMYRYRGEKIEAKLSVSNIKNGEIILSLKESRELYISIGQSIVVYDGDIVIGGGVVQRLV